jgi:hypothetical protein
VVLDSVTDECGHLFCTSGSIDNAQFLWLQDQVALAEDMGQYVLTFAHHTFATMDQDSADLTEQPTQNGAGLEAFYCQHPSILAHIAGHEHRNDVRVHDCAPPAPSPEFWEVSTAAHIDWPQQARMIELIENVDGTVSLLLTVLDHAALPRPGPRKGASGSFGVLRLASIARELAYNDWQHARIARGGPEDRNVLILLGRPWPPPVA